MVQRLLVCLVLLAPVALSQAPGDQLCGTCETTGVVDVEVPGKWLLEYARGDGWEVVHCSEAAEADNMTLDWMPCPRCKAPSLEQAAQARWDAIAAEKQAWLEERRRMDRFTSGEPIIHLETTHFVIAWDISKIKASDKKTYRAHEAAHLYAERMEALYHHYQTLLGVVDADNMRNKHHVYIFDKLRDAMKVGPVYANMSSNSTARRAGGVEHESTAIMYRNKNLHPDDDDLHRHWIHTIVHQLTSVHYNVNWFAPGEKGLSPPWLADKYGWLDAGLAHWFEVDFDGAATTYCTQEQDTTSRWKGGDWHKNVWKSVMSEDVPSFPQVISIPTQALTPQQHQFVWSWVDYLMHLDPKAMGMAIKLAKKERPTRELLREAWGVSMLSFETDWAEWVKTEYAPTNKRR